MPPADDPVTAESAPCAAGEEHPATETAEPPGETPADTAGTDDAWLPL